MKLPTRYWVNVVSILGFIAIISWLPAGIVGELFSIFTVGAKTGLTDENAKIIGTIFGFSCLAMLLVGAVAVPGELTGLVRAYKSTDPWAEAARVTSKNVLLIAAAVLSWNALFFLGLFLYLLR
jgi:hypothetical protein